MSKVIAANFSIGQFFKSASMFTPTSSIVTISAISSGSITFTPALSNYTTIRSASLSWLDSTSLGPFYSITGGGSFQSIDSTAFSVLFSFGSTTTIVTQSNSSFIFNSSSIVGASTRQFSISYLTQSLQSYYDDTVEEAYVQLTIDTTNNENSIKFDTGLLNSTTGEVEFTSNTPVKGGIGTSARGIGSFAMGSGSIAQESASIAEGINTLASGLASHAAGINTTASGQAAFSMGIETDADGMASFAAGSGSWARGTATVAMGIGTIASASGQTVVGHYNLGLGDFNNLFVVGGGSGATTNLRKNLFRVYGGSGASTVGVEINTSETQYLSTIEGFSIIGNTRFLGDISGSVRVGGSNIQLNDDSLNLNATSSFTILDTDRLTEEPALDFNKLVINRFGINFDRSNKSTSPGSKYLWTNSSDRLFYGSNAIILNDGNTLGTTMTIGTTDTNNLELETGGTTRIFISSSGNVGIGTSSPTERLHVQGNSLFSGSIKFDPTQDPDLAGLDTDSTILFQSSSNTLLGYDLYFRQNGNLVKWKWFEGLLESGLLYGGVVTYSGSFVYVSPGSGILVDHNAVTGSEIGPIVDYITWSPITQSITNIATQQLTYIYIDDTGALQQQSTAFTSQQYHSSIPLGAVAHFNYNSIGSFGGSVQTSYDQTSQILTFVDAFGPLKISGYGITGQSSSLQISVGSGTSFIHGGFYDNDPQFPSEILTTSQLTASIVYVHRSGSGVKFDSNNNNYFTSLRPGFYDPGTGNTASLSSNNWTIQRAYSEPKTGIVYVYYGQNVYTTYNEAVANVSSDSFTEGDTFNYTTFLGFLILKSDTTDITNTSDNKIITAGLFRGGAGGAGGGSTVSSLDDLSDVSILSPTNGQALVYNSSTSLWGNGVPVTSSYALTASFITPTGTNAFVQGGNSFGTTALLGTNDTQDLQFETSGSVRMTISSSGRVGIGTTNPEAQLHVTVGAAGTVGSIIRGATSQTANLTQWQNSAGVVLASMSSLGALNFIGNAAGTFGYGSIGINGSEFLFMPGTGGINFAKDISGNSGLFMTLTTGNVGIGTTSPTARLHISGANNGALLIASSSTAPSALFVSGSGNVGIGTTTPTSLLQVAGRVTSTELYVTNGDAIYTTNGSVGIGTSGPTSTNRLQVRGSGATSATTALRVENSAAAARLTILDDGTSAFNTSHLYISSSGNVGIGLTSMTARLHVSGASNAGLFEIDSPTINNIIYVSGSGNVGIGTNLPSADLHISGASADNLLRVGSPTNANILFVTGSGNIGIGTATPTNTLQVVGGITATSITASIISASSGITASQYSGVPTFTYNDNNFQSVNIINTSNTSNALNGLTIYSASNASVGQFLYLNPIYANSALRDTVLFNSVGDRKLGFVANTTTAAGANSDIYFQAGSTTAGRMIYISGQAGAMGIGMGASTPTSTNRLQVRGQGATSATTALRVENSSAAARLTILDDGTSAFNTSHLYVSSSGNVGIGLTSPLAKLHISGANSLRMQNTGFDTFEWFFSAGTGIGFRNVTDGTTPFFVGGTDDIGIGTTNTSAKLHVSGASNIGLFEIDSPTINNIIYVSGSGNVGIGTNLPSADFHISGASADNLLRVGSPTQANILFVSGSGRVGVGTTTPRQLLHVAGGNIALDGTQFIDFGNGNSRINDLGLVSGQGYPITISTFGPIGTGTANSLTEKLRLTGSGSLGLGTTLPSARFHISGGFTDGNLMRVQSPTGAEYFFISASGNVGIGTNLPSAELHISGASIDSLLRVGSPTQTNTLFITGSNRVGIGTGTPRALFEVNDKIIAEAGGNVGIQTTADYWIHLSTDPGGGKHLNIDATQTSNPPAEYTPSGGSTMNKVVGNISDSNVLGTPDYWMEIKLGGTTVLIPCYTPTP